MAYYTVITLDDREERILISHYLFHWISTGIYRKIARHNDNKLVLVYTPSTTDSEAVREVYIIGNSRSTEIRYLTLLFTKDPRGVLSFRTVPGSPPSEVYSITDNSSLQRRRHNRWKENSTTSFVSICLKFLIVVVVWLASVYTRREV